MEFIDYVNIANFGMFYSMLGALVYEISELAYAREHENKHYKMIKININDVFTDCDVSTEKKIELMDLLNVNSINRCYILYYIFQKRGTYYTSNDIDNYNDACNDACNAYDEYAFWKNNFGNGKEFNLDETATPTNTILLVDGNIEREFSITYAQINFISWLYYSGLYDYLMDNLDVKRRILDEMNEKKLFAGNMFLQYILFTTRYEDIPIQDTTTQYFSNDEEAEKAPSEEENNSSSEEENNSSSEEEHYNGYNQMIGDIDKYRFLYDLRQASMQILRRAYNGFVEIFNNEYNEYNEYKTLFKSHLG